MGKKKKVYVVWVGRKVGIFDTWNDCKIQVDNFFGAKFMSFSNLSDAEIAYKKGYESYWGKKNKIKKELSEEDIKKIGLPELNSISVDGAWNTSTLKAEYQGVATKDKRLLFHQGPFEDGTNNMVEFLGIVHALSYCKKHSLKIPIYSDSKIAIGWVKQKKMATNKEKNKKNETLFNLLDRAVKWLNENNYDNKILKWETKAWGENPADFGRK